MNLGQKRGSNWRWSFKREMGYKVVHRNYRYLRAKIDIIAKKGDILAIVEVL